LQPGNLVIAPAAGSSTDYGDVAIGASVTRSFTLTNPAAEASGPLTITTDNSQFAVDPGDCAAGDLVDGSSCTFSVAMTPTDSLIAAANVSAQSPGAGRASIAIAGRGRQKAALAATGNRDLGRAYIGLAAPENEFASTTPAIWRPVLSSWRTTTRPSSWSAPTRATASSSLARPAAP
jgi:hypothetical protein